MLRSTARKRLRLRRGPMRARRPAIGRGGSVRSRLPGERVSPRTADCSVSCRAGFSDGTPEGARTNCQSSGTRTSASSRMGTNDERRQRCGPAREDRRVVFAAAVRADAGVPLERPEGLPVFDAREIARGVERPVRCWRATPDATRSAAVRPARRPTPTTSALELLMPEARGRSLANTMSAAMRLRRESFAPAAARRPRRSGAHPA